MNRAKLQAIYRYGAILSVVGTAIAIIAFVMQGPNSFIGLLFGFLAPLCGFFFIGAVFYSNPTYYVWGEELLRGVAWYFGSLVGWAIIITESNVLPATAFTVLGLPVLTALGLTLLLVGIRKATGLELKVRSEGGQLLNIILGTIAFGFLVFYLVLVNAQPPSFILLYALAAVIGLVLWWRYLRPQSTAS